MAPVTLLKKLLDIRHTVVFRLTVWYSGIFTISLFVAFVAFYMLVLRGSHNIPKEALSWLREDFREYFGTMLIIVLSISTLIGWLMAKRALTGVEIISQATTAIARGALGTRVPISTRNDEIDRLASNFNSMVERIESLIKDMKETNDNIAHDLKSPITRMRGIAELTLGSEASKEFQQMASTVIEECDRLLSIINTMLAISETEAGITSLRLEEVDIELLIRDLLDLFDPLIEDKSLSVNLHISGPKSIQADKQKIQRVLSNVLDNAIKFTPQGGSIMISVTGKDNEVQIVLRDTGIGIPEDELPHIFDRFFRGERSRSTPGSGLGLSLAHAFVSAHNGRITVKSMPEGGSEFTIILPKTLF
ncbi:MAG TPA: HAMP domain-containing sensor histidine kinase [Syntrophorhabdaceae bacterium]|nr:HAMP domain-containing sensor histidine kinase [Syntrophorhabdaceae bacterium]HPP42682.1 HAMP domain-containing sensor histidine kinase [Syntrophorhabdaceae bacterium]